MPAARGILYVLYIYIYIFRGYVRLPVGNSNHGYEEGANHLIVELTIGMLDVFSSMHLQDGRAPYWL